MSNAAQLSAHHRLMSMDVLRGLALCGILVMNIQTFALQPAAYVRPTLLGPQEGPNVLAWVVTHVLGDLKFLSIFSLVFGAGLASAAALKTTQALRVRQRWLIVLGLLHAYLVWYGDVLFTYGLVGLWVIRASQWPLRRALTAAAVCLAMPIVILPAFELLLPVLPDFALRLVNEGYDPSAARIAADEVAMRGSWLEQLRPRAMLSFELQTFGLVTVAGWRAAGFMLLGIVFFRSGLLAGERPGLERQLTVWGLGLGLPLAGVSAALLVSLNFPVNTGLSLSLPNYVASIGVALGLTGAVLWWLRSAASGRVARALSAAGTLALTNYLLQSAICTLLFYGQGLALFGQLERWVLLPLALGIWLVQVLLSLAWHTRFGPGPAERVLRWLVSKEERSV